MTEKPTLDQWAAAAAKEVKGKDLTWRTPEGIDVKPLYTAAFVGFGLAYAGFLGLSLAMDRHHAELLGSRCLKKG